MVNAGKQIRSDMKYAASDYKTTQEGAETSPKNIAKKAPDELYEEAPAFPKTSDVCLFKKKNYQFFVSVGLNSSRMRPVVCVLDTDTSTNST